MKKVILSFLTLVMTAAVSYAQFTSKDVFTKDEIIWYGLDFTKAKFIGAMDQGGGASPATGGDIKNKYMPEWNMLVVNEPAHFDFKKAMDKASIYFDIKPVTDDNAKTDKDALMSMNANTLSKADAEAVVAGLGAGDKKEGIAMVWVVENFNKTEKAASFWVVFFDIKTKKILFSEHIQSKATQGIGLKNYWGSSVKSAIKEMDKSYWADWKSKYK